MAKMRKQKEDELFNTFQMHTLKMSDKLSAEMQQKVDDEDERIAKAVEQREKKRLAEVERKQQEEKETREATNQHRLEMMEEARRIKEENLIKDKAFLSRKITEYKNSEKKRREDEEIRRSKSVHLRSIHKDQIAVRSAKVGEEKAKELESDKQNMEGLVMEEAAFQEYAEKVIGEAQSRGRNTYPLRKARSEGPGGGRGPKFEGNAGLRPSYLVMDGTGVQLPHYPKDETAYNKVYGHVGKSNGRLGFKWDS